MFDRISDAVGYLSSIGKLEREGMETAICAMLSDSIGTKEPPLGTGCLGEFRPADLTRLQDVEFNFLSHSLGSRMLYDVLSGAIPENGIRRPGNETCVRSAIRIRTHELIMAANQMPLLAASEFHVMPAKEAHGGQLPPSNLPPEARTAFVNLTQPDCAQMADSSGRRPHLTVIAFQDPDDILGFKASDAVLGTDDDITIIDVLHRNANQWAFLFASPAKAHDHELKERHSRQMILCGADELSDGSLRARKCGTGATK
jgi:hypothetical protein